MLKYIPMQSGSAGNGALLYDETTLLVLDAGVSVDDTRQVLRKNNKSLNDFKRVAVLITHSHLDHSKYQEEWMKVTDAVYYPTMTELPNLDMTVDGTFSISNFDVDHNVATWGFQITHQPTNTNIFWMTDAAKIPGIFRTQFPPADIFLIELNNNMFMKPKDLNVRNEVMYHNNATRHLSHQQVVPWLKQAMKDTKYVHFLHVSRQNDQFAIVKKATDELAVKYPNVQYSYIESKEYVDNHEPYITIGVNEAQEKLDRMGIV